MKDHPFNDRAEELGLLRALQVVADSLAGLVGRVGVSLCDCGSHGGGSLAR